MNLIETSAWAEEMDMAVTVCDNDGKIVYMNQSAISKFHKYGGASLIGRSLFDCHNPQSQHKIKEMIDLSQSNIYVTNSNGDRRMIRQFPWIDDGVAKGIIEISFDLPTNFEEKIR